MTARDLAFAVAGAAIVIAACGTPGDTARADTPPDGFADGSRIKARWSSVTFADGAKGRTFLGWWDSERKEECTPSTLSSKASGPGWCVPTGYAPPAAVLFSDASCSTPAAFSAVPGARGVMYAGALWALGEAIALPASVWVLDSGACTARTWSGAGHAKPIPVPLSQFVAVTIGAP